MQMGQSTLRAKVDPSTLMMPMVLTLGLCLQSPTMLIRSLVSPDWLMRTTVQFSVMSEGYIQTGSTMLTFLKHRNFLKQYQLAQAAQQLDPQASMVRKSPNSMACTLAKLASKGMTACCLISQLYQCLYCGGGLSSTFCGYVMWISLSLMRYFSCGTSLTFSSKISWSLEGKKQFTCFSNAILQETTKISSYYALNPISRGEPLVAVQIVSGVARSIITKPHCESLPALALNSSSASSIVLPSLLRRARNCTITSVSVLLVNLRSCRRSFLSEAWLVRMPLCTRQICFPWSKWGCELRSTFSPQVAQRVCAIPLVAMPVSCITSSTTLLMQPACLSPCYAYLTNLPVWVEGAKVKTPALSQPRFLRSSTPSHRNSSSVQRQCFLSILACCSRVIGAFITIPTIPQHLLSPSPLPQRLPHKVPPSSNFLSMDIILKQQVKKGRDTQIPPTSTVTTGTTSLPGAQVLKRQLSLQLPWLL